MTMSNSRVVLVNSNEIRPPVAPIALDYLAGALSDDGRQVDVLDLSFAADAFQALADYFCSNSVLAVGMTFRNSDDCFWPSAASFVPRLVELAGAIRGMTDAPLVLGGGGFSLFPEAVLEACDCEFGLVGDGERAFVEFVRALERGRGLDRVPGLVRRAGGPGTREFTRNPPDRPSPLNLSTSRDNVDNLRYFREGGQGNLETKRGCDRACTYCADPLIKGTRLRLRALREVAEELEALLRQGIDVFHLCDSEFNIPPHHATAVCEEFARRGLGSKARWYTYASVIPFPDEVAGAMRKAGCVGINFGTDSASASMLAAYGRRHCKEDIAQAVCLCREHGMRVMIDLLLGGPGETEATVRETIDFMKQVGPDCVGAALGVRIYPGMPLAARLCQEGPLSANPNVWVREDGGAQPFMQAAGDLADGLLKPAFYISKDLSHNPAQLVRDLIGGDTRFFAPVDEQSLENYNYNENLPLVEAIRDGARGAYWDILSQMRSASA